MTKENKENISAPKRSIAPIAALKNLSDITIFENDYFIAINKPAGVLSIPDRMQSEPSLKDKLLEKYGSIFTIHRLDKETSGIILFAKDESTHKFFSRQFEERSESFSRRYFKDN